MKKLLIAILIVTAVSSCKKSGQCYNCEFGVIDGYRPPAEEYCGPMPYKKQINGVDVMVWCKLK